MTICLRLLDPLDNRIPVPSPVDSESRLRQLELVVFPPLAAILRPGPRLMAQLFDLGLDLRQTSVPVVFSEQKDSDWVRGGCGFERVLCRVVDQDLCVDLLADLHATWSRQIDQLATTFDTHICFVQLGNCFVPIRKCPLLGLPGADHRLKDT